MKHFCKSYFIGFVLSITCNQLSSQNLEIPVELGIDSNYMKLCFYSNKAAKNLLAKFNKIDTSKLVVFHYGGSHIQAEIPVSKARDNFAKILPYGGRGMVFSYSAAKTYSSINYISSHSGNWNYGKSFQNPPGVPLGVCGMAVESSDSIAELLIDFKKDLPIDKYQIKLLTEIDSLTPSFKVFIDSALVFEFQKSAKEISQNKDYFEWLYNGKIKQLRLSICDTLSNLRRFRFFGFDIELNKKNGLVYHSLGVGAAPFGSVLKLEKIQTHAAILKPDIVILDFGTNDILKNKIQPNLSKQIKQAIDEFRNINPDIVIILTSTQDIYFKKKRLVTAAVPFRDLIDSIARAEDCLFWNWYDLSGGLTNIKTWYSMGYAQKDLIHLTIKGYHVKGELLFQSFQNTLNEIRSNVNTNEYYFAPKEYKNPKLKKKVISTKKPSKNANYYTVKSGDTLSSIARKHQITLAQLKKLNALKSDRISKGQLLKVK